MNQFSNSQYPIQFPFSFTVPSQQSSPGLMDNESPARVRIALEVLSQLTSKVMPRAAATDNSIEWADMPKLTGNETALQGAACSLLIDYLGGKLKMDRWEETRHKASTRGLVPNKPGVLLRCHVCAPDFTDDCRICANKRTILVYPS
jgi:hypothetical protein